ncbi:G5 domain-containing protein [Kribbella sp. NBC_00382]|uniref:G5 domain-containing protein n=1 Tax=Kribbella sp. NBC_00382 TaxID=2975967 RepID=UPI002E1E3EDA
MGGLLIALALLLTGCGIETSSPRVAGRVTSTTDPGAAASSDASAEPSATEAVTPSSTPSTPPSTSAGTPSVPPPALVSKPVKATPVVVTKNVVVVRSVAFKKKNVRDPERPQGESAVTTRGVKGKKQLTYAVTYTDGKETGRRLVREVVTVAPVTQITSIGTKKEETGGGCDPNYTGCVPIASDVDCEGGTGNGPAYVAGPVEVIGSDIYRLDADHDGIGCEDG